jgi:hypothetical protein
MSADMARRGTRLISRAGRAACLCALLALRVAPGAAGATDAPVLAAVGDIACTPGAQTDAYNCHQQQTSDLVVGAAPAAVALLGDTQYETGTPTEYVGSFDPTWGRLKSLTWPAPGNHEYGTPNATGYFGYFGARAGDPSLGYYSYDLGSWHIVALNSNCADPATSGPPACANADHGRVTAAQVKWLEQDLAGHPAACTLAYWHHPRFSSGVHGGDAGTAPLWDTLYAHGADVVLNGHDHDYERFGAQDTGARPDPQYGIREFVVGTGGKSHFPFFGVAANSEYRNGAVFGALFLTLRTGGYDWSFRSENGTVLDSGSGACHGTAPAAGGAPSAGAAVTALAAAPIVLAEAQPKLSSLRITPTAFASATSGPSARAARRRRPVGATVSYLLARPTSVRFTIEQRQVGRRQGTGRRRRCVQRTRANRAAPRCTRRVALRGSFTVAGTAGVNRFSFTGRISGKRLKPGSYILVGAPVVRGQSAARAGAAFRVIP